MSSSTLPRPTAPGVTGPAAESATRLKSMGRALLGGRADHARWERPAFIGLLAVAAIAYISNLSISGYANEFYSAAAQAGSQNWEAFLYGSSDAGNSITVDKPPASLWVMAVFVKLFGLSSWSILLPEALMGVATVALVYVIVRRHFRPSAALVAGAVMVTTPVAALMFRFNNPDALLVLLLTAAAYFTLRAIESGRVRWLLLAGAMVGLGFLTKQLQAFVILPPLALAYGWAGPVRFGRRLLHLLAALGAVIVSAGWWVAIVELVPASARPFIGGSQTNDFLELTFGYNGFGRITGDETGSVTGGATRAGGAMWGQTGITRLFDGEFGGQIAWLIPAALAVMVAAFVLLRRSRRTDARRATIVIFGGWLVVTGLVFSFMAGIFHSYYTVALAPAIAVLVGAGGLLLWNVRRHLWARILMAAIVLVSGVWAFSLLTRAESWAPPLKFVVLVFAVVGALLLLFRWKRRSLRVATITVSLTALLLAPAAYTLDTIASPHTGSLPTAGPAVAGSGGFGGGGGFARRGNTFGGTPPQAANGQAGGFGRPGGAAGGTAGATTGTGGAATGTRGGTGFTGFGGGGGLLGGVTVNAQLSSMISADSSSYRWAAATVGSQNAASYQLTTGASVMPVGGFNGSDPSPTLDEFKAYVAAGDIHYFIGGSSIGVSNGGSSASSEIAEWVKANFASTTVGGTTVYDLTAAASGVTS